MTIIHVLFIVVTIIHVLSIVVTINNYKDSLLQVYIQYIIIVTIKLTIHYYSLFITHYSLLQVYIQYMKFARRAEGIPAARAVFKKAREDTKSNYHVSKLLHVVCHVTRNVSCHVTWHLFMPALRMN